MRVRSMSGGSRALIFGMASAVATVSAVTGGSLTAAAESNASIPGSLSVVAVPGSFHLQQLSTGTDGKLWFVTPQSQLGAISASGQATLTGVVLPHGNVPAPGPRVSGRTATTTPSPIAAAPVCSPS